jgi:hypothetical protein
VKGRGCVAATVLEKKLIEAVDDCVKTIYSPNPVNANRTPIVKAAQIRIYSTCPASGNVFVRVASHAGLSFGLLPSLQQLDQSPYSMQKPQTNLWACDDEDQMQPGGGSA